MFLANENFPKPSTLILRKSGFIVKSIQEDCPGITDPDVMKIALMYNLIVLTFDSDYGELIFKHAKDNPPSIVYFREKGQQPEFAAKFLISILGDSSIKLSGAFTVIEAKNIRQRFYKN